MNKIGKQHGDDVRPTSEWLTRREDFINTDNISHGNQEEWLSNFEKPYEIWRFECPEISQWEPVANLQVSIASGYAILKGGKIVGWYVTDRN